MKARYIVLGLVMMLALSVHAREYETGERLYINMEAKSVKESGDDNLKYGWYSTTSNYNYAYFFNGTTSAWSTQVQQYSGSVWYVVVPAGDWDNVILTRHNSANASWDTKITQTGNINIGASYALNKNYIDNFYYGTYKEEADWQSITLSPSGSPVDASAVDGVNKEVIDACTSSIGDPLSLQPILAGNPLVYDYNNSAAHAWFKWNGSAWVALDGQKTGKHSNVNAWGYEGGAELHETIGAANSHTYYFLWTEKPSRRRFVEIAVTKDCSPTCEITDFGVVTSSVNAHDSTYVLDGIVAFKDANEKTLRISVTDAKGEHHVDYVNPSTPLIFSLPDLFADGATGLVATARFIGTDYFRNSEPYTAPNAIIGINTTVKNIAHDEPVTLTPSTPGTDGFKWHDGNTSDHDRVIPAYDFDTTIIYTYYEFEKAPEVGGNLIINGDFSTPGFNYGTENFDKDVTKAPFSTISDYHYWGKDITSASDFYKLKGDINGGMAIVQDANAFWKRYTKTITTKQGTHFALFDADNSGEKAAWKIETGATHPNLKLAKGTNYMFSFWVANINNYGEMNNAATLQFEISYSQDGGSTWSTPEKLGNPINLNDYPDNLWHQNSHVYVATTDASKVRISVKDLNNSSNPGGNDFALDDIRFQPISVVSQAIKHCERFVVNIYEAPVVVEKPVITITQTPACGMTDFTMEVKVSYSTLNNKYPVTLQLTDDVYGALFATPVTIDPAVNPNSITLTLPTATYAILVADGAVHTLTAKITRLDGAGVDKGGENSNTYTSPGIPAINTPVLTVIEPSCDKTTFDLQVVADYRAFKGAKLHYEWDGAEWTNADLPSLTYKEVTWQTATGKLKDLPADGQNHTLRVYSDNATLDCEYSFPAVAAPATPAIDTVQTAFSAPACTDLTTTLTFDLDYTYQQGTLTYWVDAMAPQTATYSVADKTKQTLTGLTFAGIPADGKNNHVLHVSFDGANSCVKSYNLPAVPFSPVISSVVVSGVPAVLDCEETQYNISVSVSMPYDATGKDIVITYAGKDSTLAVTANPMVASLPMTISDATNQTVSAHYSDSPACITTSAPFDDPARSTIDTVQTAFSAPACTDLTTTLTFDLDYTYQQGTLTYWVDAMAPQTATYSVADKTKQTLTGLTFAGIPADGKNNHVLHVSFDGANSCVKSYNLPAVPFSPVISSVVISGVPATVLCEEKYYSFTVTITTPYDATGRNIVLSGSKDTTVAATGTSTVVTIKKTDIGGDAQAVTAALEATPTCTKSSDSFTPPVRTSCNKWYDDICEGENYTLHGFNIINPSVGKHSYSHPDNIYDSLFLTVHAMPVISIAPVGIICDSEAQIALPFTVVNGAPDTYDIAIGSTHYAGTVSGTDITFAMAPELVAGDYTAVVTAGTLGTDCSSQVTVNFTIADGSHLFSKWTDVLFVDNSEGRFVSYQWYEDGYLMSGETQQRLYNPDGLTGSYYCRMTTTDGKTIYTCEQAFDKVTPSRTANSSTSAAAPAVYDTMGRPVQGTPRNGIYIMIEEHDGERFVKKVLIHE